MSVPTEKVKIIIDTDSGVDDALAIMLAFSRPDLCEVIAITCCVGNTSVDNVCDNVLKVCKVCGVDQMDIYKGCDLPLISEPSDENFFGLDGLGDVPETLEKADIAIKEEHASIALVRLAKKFPKEITLVAIAPLTNIAVSQRLDSSFLSNLKSLVILGGNTTGSGNVTKTAEFNFFADPEAAYLVLSTKDTCPFTIVPWETCQKHEMQKEWLLEWQNKNTKKGEMVKKIMKVLVDFGNKNNFTSIGDADVLAVAAAINPSSVVKFIETTISVELHGEQTRGQATVDKRPRELWPTDTKHILRKIVTEFDDSILLELRNSIVN